MEAVNANMEQTPGRSEEDLEARIRARVAAAISAGGGVRAVEKSTGIPKGTLEKYAAQTSTASFTNAAKIASAAGVTLDQIAFSQEDMSKNGASERLRAVMDRLGNLSDRRSETRTAAADANQTAMIRLPTYSGVRASAGPGALATSEEADGVISFDPRFLRDQGAVPEKCVVIWAHGDSMTPTIPDGSALIVDHSQTEIKNGSIMVIGVGEDVLVKRVRRRLDGLIELISDNSAYAPETLGPAALQQLRVIGRVVYFCRTP